MQNRTAVQNWDVPIPRVRWYLEVIQLTLQERISERIIVQIVVISVPHFQEQIVEIVIILSGAVSAARWRQFVVFHVPQVVKEIVEGILWLFAPKSTSQRNWALRDLGNFLARRARVRDDPGRSPQIELELERSF